MYDLHDFLSPISVHKLNDDKGYTDGQLARHIAIYENELPDITDADIVLVDLQKKKIVRGAEMFTKVKWTPFEGVELQGWPVMTLVGGQVVFENGQVDENARGQEIQINE